MVGGCNFCLQWRFIDNYPIQLHTNFLAENYFSNHMYKICGVKYMSLKNTFHEFRSNASITEKEAHSVHGSSLKIDSFKKMT